MENGRLLLALSGYRSISADWVRSNEYLIEKQCKAVSELGLKVSVTFVLRCSCFLRFYSQTFHPHLATGQLTSYFNINSANQFPQQNWISIRTASHKSFLCNRFQLGNITSRKYDFAPISILSHCFNRCRWCKQLSAQRHGKTLQVFADRNPISLIELFQTEFLIIQHAFSLLDFQHFTKSLCA